ncbi:uncharacterized protein LOC126794530 [Argentina anserina]|uniref:uncharacterized protein LOC126794530 n=1 Tax=Argentina anserina TaxID=57926 RepID=UPI0021768A6A|nr:uncharacterized protein LOC126794530 [Potentilla anserina]
MAISSLGFACRPNFNLRIPAFQCIGKVQLNLVAAMEAIDEREGQPKDKNTSNSGSRFEVYLVGGCVRDLILKRTPTDFDILTTAELREVTRTFSWCEVVGRRFPICHVHVGDTVVEVFSFSISARSFGRNSTSEFKKPVHCDDKDFMRWSNCLKRDFTINGLMFDPYARIVYDYLGGIEDLQKAKLQTVIPASTSFQEDCARILRAIRIAAHLGFRISKETADSIKSLSYSILRLDKGRILMEMNYMLAYGSAEASLRLLWKFGLLELLLPIQAAYFVRHGFRRHDKRSNMLLIIFLHLTSRATVAYGLQS